MFILLEKYILKKLTMNRKIKFLDQNNNLVRIEVNIKDGKFSISGEVNGSMGQCQDSIKPNGKYQRRLIAIWNKWHLNDLNPGTKKQIKFLNNCGIDFSKYKDNGHNSEYEYKCWVLQVNHLFIDKGFKYGHGWLTEKLPINFEEKLNNLLDKIEEKYKNNKERLVTEDDVELFSDFNYPNVALALALMLELCINEINDISYGCMENFYTVQGIDYLCGDDNDMDDEWDKELENYIEEYVLFQIPEQYRNYFDNESFKKDCKIDGRANFLNKYNGDELSICLNETYYYAYRQ